MSEAAYILGTVCMLVVGVYAMFKAGDERGYKRGWKAGSKASEAFYARERMKNRTSEVIARSVLNGRATPSEVHELRRKRWFS